MISEARAPRRSPGRRTFRPRRIHRRYAVAAGAACDDDTICDFVSSRSSGPDAIHQSTSVRPRWPRRQDLAIWVGKPKSGPPESFNRRTFSLFRGGDCLAELVSLLHLRPGRPLVGLLGAISQQWSRSSPGAGHHRPDRLHRSDEYPHSAGRLLRQWQYDLHGGRPPSPVSRGRSPLAGVVQHRREPLGRRLRADGVLEGERGPHRAQSGLLDRRVAVL